jgi:hypothetical protein
MDQILPSIISAGRPTKKWLRVYKLAATHFPAEKSIRVIHTLAFFVLSEPAVEKNGSLSP